ncbi:hypothetical protein OQJ15_06365 [Fluoribacter dumoffii]|uniref:Uncharacterized protein n=1 Tax=Fluoribacter dumoffii TaxID=463 RepID=A0A377GA97_9GAMM|nr:hypothetical protein [Fluoribacter dumoffii]KTC88780.1 hypothetical protein Ldum_3038 [Fluoribacter dumoffii NY 23]MCW8385925.1 hypothetical protein [Fluoribacter dumoffii]MCW8495781.1 hypothetical protein [Fluoribacter dumoffii]STO21732.1 Uncharacterised protein [Fluoribacter dumoffii]
MLGLISFDEINFVLNNPDDPNHSLSGEYKRIKQVYKRRPSFFDPYQNGKQWIGGAIAPIVYPLEFASLGLIGIVAGVGSLIATLGCGLAGIGAVISGYASVQDKAFRNASQFLYYAGYSLVNAAAGLLLALLSIPCSLIVLGTRSLATVTADVLECMNNASMTTEVYPKIAI